jgi:hypothetical protein
VQSTDFASKVICKPFNITAIQQIATVQKNG